MDAMLALEDGRRFRGRAFGVARDRTGEVVFNTAMTGYQEGTVSAAGCGQPRVEELP